MIESAKSSSYGVCSHLLLKPARQSSNSARLGSGHQPSCNLTFRGINLCARQTKSRSQHPKEYSNRPRESTRRHTRLVQIQGGWLKQVTVEAKLTNSQAHPPPRCHFSSTETTTCNVAEGDELLTTVRVNWPWPQFQPPLQRLKLITKTSQSPSQATEDDRAYRYTFDTSQT